MLEKMTPQEEMLHKKISERKPNEFLLLQIEKNGGKIENTLLDQKNIEIEKNKDKTNLRSNLNFVEKNKDLYQNGLNAFLSNKNKDHPLEITFGGSGEEIRNQIPEEIIVKIIQSLPTSLKKVSNLKKVLYFDLVLVPHFKEDGNFDETKIDQVKINDFPRKNDHPSRLMIGATDKEGNIYMTPIPNTVSKDKDAVHYYQIHVFLHEFFHSIELAKRDPKKRSKIIFSYNGEQFSFQDRWEDFEKLILSKKEPKYISSYAEVYHNDLTMETKAQNPDKFTHALAEQICETFVAYILNIISNNDSWNNFKSENFGNKTINSKNDIDPKNMKWILMNKLYNAKLIENGEE